MSALTEFQYKAGGLHLPALGLWLDATRPVKGEERVVVTHAHSDHAAAHREVICTHATLRFLQARIGGRPVAHEQAYHQTCEYAGPGGSCRITLLPAGHILGSAMVLIEAEGRTLLYTGDFKLRSGQSCEACAPCHADVLVMETTFGRPEYRFPPAQQVVQSIARFCRETLDNNELPVLQGYALGKSQELLCCLREEGFALMVHPQVHKLAAIYAELGCRLPEYALWDPATQSGKVLICPPGSTEVRGSGPVRSAWITGWGMDPNFRFRSRCDAAFPLSDHADFPELLEMVQRVSPARVCTLHGFAADFAEVLRAKGVDALCLSEEDQLGLRLEMVHARGATDDRTKEGPPEQTGQASVVRDESDSTDEPGNFGRFASVCAEIQAAKRKGVKGRVLGDFFRQLTKPDLAVVMAWFSATAGLEAGPRPAPIGWGFLRDTLCPLAGLGDQELREVYLRHGDTAETVRELLARKGARPSGLRISQVAEVVEELGQAKRGGGAVSRWRRLLEASSPLEGKWLTKVLDGGLRLGLTSEVLEDALSEAYSLEIQEVRRAARVMGDWAEVAVLASEHRLAEAHPQPFWPVRFMSAGRGRDVKAALDRVRSVGSRLSAGSQSEFFAPKSAEAGAWVEPAYVGLRCQLHKAEQRARLYSMDRSEVTLAFPEIVQYAVEQRSDFILDGMIVAMRADKFLPLQVLEVHLGRRERDLFPEAEVSFRFVAFDLFWWGGNTLVSEPLWERRRRLEALGLSSRCFMISEVLHASAASDVEVALHNAARLGHKGVVLKDPQGEYHPGRRSNAWIALPAAGVRFDSR